MGVVRELSTLPYTRDSVNAKRLGVKTFFLGSFFFFPFSDFPQLQNEREKKSNYQTRLESSLDAWDAFEARFTHRSARCRAVIDKAVQEQRGLV